MTDYESLIEKREQDERARLERVRKEREYQEEEDRQRQIIAMSLMC